MNYESELTKDQDSFLCQLARTALFWAHHPAFSCEDKVTGVVFSLLVCLDGGSVLAGGVRVIPRWYGAEDKRRDIAGDLHSAFHRIYQRVKAESLPEILECFQTSSPIEAAPEGEFL